MRNHDQKNKDMGESVLPSTSRKRARVERRIAHGTNRAAERVVIRRALRGVDSYADGLSDADGRRRGMVREMVWDRRSGDKIGSLVRWARVTVRRDPELRDAEPAHVLAYFAALLPDNTIGRHAVEHIKWGLFGYDFGSGGISWEERQARRKAADATERERFRANVVALMAAGRHRDINRAVAAIRGRQLDAIARAKAEGLPWEHIEVIRPLAGLHDIDAFVERTCRNAALRDAVVHLAATLLR